MNAETIMPQEEIKKSSLPEEVTRSSGLLEDGKDCINDKDQLLSLHIPYPTKALKVEDPSWLVDWNKLRSLAESDEIRDALKDPELLKIVLQIDSSSEPEKELEKLMEGQSFQVFTNKILDIVIPQE